MLPTLEIESLFMPEKLSVSKSTNGVQPLSPAWTVDTSSTMSYSKAASNGVESLNKQWRSNLSITSSGPALRRPNPHLVCFLAYLDRAPSELTICPKELHKSMLELSSSNDWWWCDASSRYSAALQPLLSFCILHQWRKRLTKFLVQLTRLHWLQNSCQYAHDYVLSPEQYEKLRINAKKAPCPAVKKSARLLHDPWSLHVETDHMWKICRVR